MNNLKYFVIWWLNKSYQRAKQIAQVLIPKLFGLLIFLSVAALCSIAFGFLIVFSADARGMYVEGDYATLAKAAILPAFILLCAYIRLQWEQWQEEQQGTIGYLNRQYRNEK